MALAPRRNHLPSESLGFSALWPPPPLATIIAPIGTGIDCPAPASRNSFFKCAASGVSPKRNSSNELPSWEMWTLSPSILTITSSTREVARADRSGIVPAEWYCVTSARATSPKSVPKPKAAATPARTCDQVLFRLARHIVIPPRTGRTEEHAIEHSSLQKLSSEHCNVCKGAHPSWGWGHEGSPGRTLGIASFYSDLVFARISGFE